MPGLEIEIDERDAGERLDIAIARRVPGLSRDRVRALFESREVKLNGWRAKKGDRVDVGDRISLASVPSQGDFHAAPDPDLELPVVVMTDRYVIVDKPPGVPSHPLREDELGTVANALVARFPEMHGIGYRNREPGIIHRLDTGTSGLMIAARDQSTFEALRQQLQGGAIEKRYLARCVGHARAPQFIELPIAPDPHNHRRVRVCTDAREVKRLAPRPAHTEIVRSEPRDDNCLVEVRANHAGRHQIRVHLAAIGHPLLGDTLYGGPALPDSPYHQLHASQITLTDPTTGTCSTTISSWNQ